MERRNFYLFMGDKEISKTTPSFKQKRNKEIKLREEDRREKSVYEIETACPFFIGGFYYERDRKISNGDACNMSLVTYQTAMPAICHWSHI